MRKTFSARLSLLFCAVLLTGIITYPMTASAEGVKVSSEDYTVTYEKANGILLSNKKSIGSGVGTEVYLTYTVESVEQCEAKIQGVAGTAKPNSSYPYVKGQMEFDTNQPLLKEGYTYFYKIEVTEAGFEYTIIRAKGEESSYVTLRETTGDKTEPMEYFGLWLGSGEVTAKLIKVRCYDKNGNDLGIQFSKNTASSYMNIIDSTLSKGSGINHSYIVTVSGKKNVAITSKKAPTSDTVIMEYAVESSGAKLSQTGIMLTKAPSSNYPYEYGNGFMNWEIMEDNGEMLVEGAEYVVYMQRTDNEFVGFAQRTYKGKVEKIILERKAGEYSKEYDFFGLWFTGDSVDCVLKDFKCYDSNGVNLGVQCNKQFTVSHTGPLEDYAGCEALYYCEKNGSVIALYSENKMKYSIGAESKDGTYSIEELDENNTSITLSYDAGKEAFTYQYTQFVNEEGKIYERLGTYQVSFVTNTDEEIETQTLSAENGYLVKRPENPKKEGMSFEGWVTSDGEEFDFETITVQSKTLYAKWSGDEEREAVSLVDKLAEFDYSPHIAVSLGVVILAVSIAGCVMFIRRGKKHEDNN